MANSQDIEARLCAYIEGELDAQQQAEIERHLEVNPQHQQMIQDLIRTRGLLGNLPRSKVPVDLGEGIQGQLERSMLLGQLDTSPDPWRRQARRLPRVVALASVLAVALGLGTVIYYLLHAAATRPSQLASSQIGTVEDPPIAAPAPDSPAPLLASLTTQPATQPAVNIAIAAPTTEPATQPTIAMAPIVQPIATTEPVAVVTGAPATMPVVLFPTTQPVGNPDDVEVAAGDTEAPLTIVFTRSDVPVKSPATQPVAGEDYRQ